MFDWTDKTTGGPLTEALWWQAWIAICDQSGFDCQQVQWMRERVAELENAGNGDDA